MSVPPEYDLEIDQGDDETILIAAKMPDGTTPEDLTGAKVWFWISATVASGPLIQKESPTGITITDPSGGLAEVAILGADTAPLDSAYLDTQLRWECQAKDGAATLITLARGNLVIKRQIVTATA